MKSEITIHILQNFINALTFAQEMFQPTMETNNFIEILILGGFISNKWRLKPK